MIEGFGTDEQKALYVEKLYSGEWTGTMCLTEAQAGSDVGASTTKAVKQDDGTYSIVSVPWDSITKAVLRKVDALPEGLFH